MYNKIDLREVPAEKLKEISLDLVNIDAQAPEFEPNRQFYFMAKARDYVKRKSAELGRPMTFFTQTFGCRNGKLLSFRLRSDSAAGFLCTRSVFFPDKL